MILLVLQLQYVRVVVAAVVVDVVLTLLAPHSHMWGKITQTIRGLSPKRDRRPKRVKAYLVLRYQ